MMKKNVSVKPMFSSNLTILKTPAGEQRIAEVSYPKTVTVQKVEPEKIPIKVTKPPIKKTAVLSVAKPISKVKIVGAKPNIKASVTVIDHVSSTKEVPVSITKTDVNKISKDATEKQIAKNANPINWTPILIGVGVIAVVYYFWKNPSTIEA